MNQMFWTVVLLGVGLLVMVLEVFIPSGGILGFISVVAIIASVVMAFVEQGPAIGMLFLTAAVVAVPSFLMMAFLSFISNSERESRISLQSTSDNTSARFEPITPPAPVIKIVRPA